jgi:hypothetical protein
MATNSIAISKDVEAISFWQAAVVVLGRFFFALIFLSAAPNHFTRQTIVFSASQGVPWVRSRFRFLVSWPSPADSAFCWATAQNWAPGSSYCS